MATDGFRLNKNTTLNFGLITELITVKFRFLFGNFPDFFLSFQTKSVDYYTIPIKISFKNNTKSEHRKIMKPEEMTVHPTAMS